MTGKTRPPRGATKKTARAKTGSKPEASASKPDLAAVRAEIDGIDHQTQALIARRALWALEVGRAKG
jgi:chorismate mutase/prephenate dehydratase